MAIIIPRQILAATEERQFRETMAAIGAKTPEEMPGKTYLVTTLVVAAAKKDKKILRLLADAAGDRRAKAMLEGLDSSS